MGTRGLLGIRYKGKTYYIYNESDSYPDGLGVVLVKEILQMLKDGTLKDFKAMMDTILIVHERDPESLSRWVDLMKTSTIPFSCKTLRDSHCPSAMAGVYEIFAKKIDNIRDLDNETLFKRMEEMPVGPIFLDFFKDKTLGFNWVDHLVGRGWRNGLWFWSVSSTMGPLERYTRLGFIYPMEIVEGDDPGDHRDLFLEYTYVVDLDRDMFMQDEDISIPFACLTSPEFYLKFIEPFYGNSYDDEWK